MPIKPILHSDVVIPHTDTTNAGHTDAVTKPHADTPSVHTDGPKFHIDAPPHHFDVIPHPQP